MRMILMLGCTACLMACATASAPKPATRLSGDELGALIAQYEQEKQVAQSNADSLGTRAQ